MRKLKLQMQISLDGFVAGPNGEHDWSMGRADEVLWQYMNEVADSADTLLLGRKMAQDFVGHFEAVPPDSPKYAFAKKMVNFRRVIFTKTLNEPFGINTELAKGDFADEINKLKSEAGKDILVYGGVEFVSNLIAGGHVDEFILFTHPLLLAKGMRIFDKLTGQQELTLLSAIPYECGVTVMRYKSVK